MKRLLLSMLALVVGGLILWVAVPVTDGPGSHQGANAVLRAQAAAGIINWLLGTAAIIAGAVVLVVDRGGERQLGDRMWIGAMCLLGGLSIASHAWAPVVGLSLLATGGVAARALRPGRDASGEDSR